MMTQPRPGRRPSRTLSVRLARSVALAAFTLALATAGLNGQQDLPGHLIRPGQTIHGVLSTSSLVAPDGSYFDFYHFHADAGQRLIVSLQSADFDAFLDIGRWGEDGFEPLAADDDGGEGTDARIWWHTPDTGAYLIRANSLAAGETGRYTITLEDAAPATPLDVAAAIPVRPGQTHAGTLTHGDPILEDGSYYHLYSFEASVGDRFTVTLVSPDFDAFLSLGWADGGQFVTLATDDDGADGTNARIHWAAPGAGTYLIQANSFMGGATGRYTLTVEAGSPR